MYQLQLKQYSENSNKLNGDLDKYYIFLIGQYSLIMEQSLLEKKDFKEIKENSDSIFFLKLIDKIY